jgi:uncharacterized protein DUF4266
VAWRYFFERWRATSVPTAARVNPSAEARSHLPGPSIQGEPGLLPLDPHPGIRTVVIVAMLLATLAGCGRAAVRATEKELLADQVMIFDEDPQEATADDHILTNREGSAGGHGGGGGCGCN